MWDRYVVMAVVAFFFDIFHVEEMLSISLVTLISQENHNNPEALKTHGRSLPFK